MIKMQKTPEFMDFKNMSYEEISARCWRHFCRGVWWFHIRKMAHFTTKDVATYLENLGELELQIYEHYNSREVPHQKYAFHKDFRRVYYDIFRGFKEELFKDIPFYQK